MSVYRIHHTHLLPWLWNPCNPVITIVVDDHKHVPYTLTNVLKNIVLQQKHEFKRCTQNVAIANGCTVSLLKMTPVYMPQLWSSMICVNAFKSRTDGRMYVIQQDLSHSMCNGICPVYMFPRYVDEVYTFQDNELVAKLQNILQWFLSIAPHVLKLEEQVTCTSEA